MNIVILAFSGRQQGNCRAIAEAIRSAHPSDNVTIYHAAALQLHPCACEDYPCFAGQPCPWISDDVYRLYEAVAQAELCYFVLANYCDYPCAAFFAFNERSQCYCQNDSQRLEAYLRTPKRFIVVSNTNQENFLTAARYHIAESTEPDLLVLSPRRCGSISTQGDMMSSAQAQQALTRFLASSERNCIS